MLSAVEGSCATFTLLQTRSAVATAGARDAPVWTCLKHLKGFACCQRDPRASRLAPRVSCDIARLCLSASTSISSVLPPPQKLANIELHLFDASWAGSKSLLQSFWLLATAQHLLGTKSHDTTRPKVADLGRRRRLYLDSVRLALPLDPIKGQLVSKNGKILVGWCTRRAPLRLQRRPCQPRCARPKARLPLVPGVTRETHTMRAFLIHPADIPALRWLYKQSREYEPRRLPHAAPVAQSAPRTVYSAEDDAAIDENVDTPGDTVSATACPTTQKASGLSSGLY
ncbi:hypothetical protein GGX14DRAFT_667800 [Mycena pura]|uniref:Uncharacterized protein n=1 Tax=Mycena pura TaxID=153505 RepID=A0AAD6UYF6_9AGAR|nr:hypothetical protein GGX14DRAFT_667800 [Mycena pura]